MPDPKLSFMPKKSFIAPTARSGGPGVILTIAVFLLIVSLVAAGGVYFYKDYLTRKTETLKKELDKAAELFDPPLVEEMYKTSKQISALKSVLRAHTSITPFFDFLSQSTLENVSFSNFNFKDDSEEGSVATLDGVARSYASIALQAREFEKNEFIRGVVFTGLSLNSNGFVNFKAKILADPAMFYYQPPQTME